jgi:antitoxin (DNA-binding transcriptional repressor) of toxin-antitoxin stability system
MRTVDILDAETDISALVDAVDAVQSGAESEIIIVRNGKSAARIMPMAAGAPRKGFQIGIAKGQFRLPDDFDDLDAEIEQLFYGEESEPIE